MNRWREQTSRAMLIVGAVAAMLLIAGVVVNVLLYLDHRDHTDAQDRRDRYVEVAGQTVINMTSLDHEHAQRDVDRVLASATGEFRTDFREARSRVHRGDPEVQRWLPKDRWRWPGWRRRTRTVRWW